MNRVNNFESTFDFTYEQKNNNTLPFEDILQINK